MASSHLDRKDLKRPDAFQSRAGDVISFLNDNSRVVLGMIALLFAAGLGFAFYSNHKTHRNEQASSALFTARSGLTVALAKAPKASPDWEKSAEQPLAEVQKQIKEHRGTVAAFEAEMYLGDLYYQHGNAQKAADLYKEALSIASSRAQKPVAQHALGYAYEQLKQYDQAIDAFRQVINSSEKSLKPDALLASARNYELKGDKAKANEQYDQVIKDFASSAAAREASIQKNRR